jgi:dipeptidyl aminopeptidase/acylaminoacyl peptidase
MKALMAFVLASLMSAALIVHAAGALTIDQLIDIRHPSSPMWSPDGRHVVFVWERAGVARLHVADAAISGALVGTPRELSAAGTQLNGAFWSADGRALMVTKNGDLWRVPIDGSAASAVWTTPAAETSIVPSPDGSRIAFVRTGNIIVRTMADGREITIAHDDRNVGGLGWSPDGVSLVFTSGARTIRHEQTPSYSGTKIIYTINENVPGRTYVVASTGGAARELAAASGGGFGGRRWLDARHFLVDRTSPDFKRRTMSVVDIGGGAAKTLNEDVEEKFWSITGDAGANGQPSPDGKWITFVSARDGWDHVYVMPAAGGPAIQITKGKFEAWRPQWSPDGTRLAFDANSEGNYGNRQLYIATINGDPAHATVRPVTSGRGTNIAPAWSPDGTRLVYQHTDPHNSADLWVVDVRGAALSRLRSADDPPSSGEARRSAKGAEAAGPRNTEVRLTDSMPSSIDRSALVEPEMVHYAGPDGQQVPAWLFVPKNLDRTKKHPAVVWIHGDGVNQNYDGWHVQRNYAVYYSFHQYLLQKGYVVIAPDYRGSIGYGKAWREAVHMDVGGKDAKDAWMAANYLKTLSYVDGERLGVWGLSYGGFFTLIAATDQPTLYRAAVDVAGVADYAMYYEDPYHGGWTASRIGTPEEHPQVYAQASPLSHVDRLERPLLVLHGTSDVNVPYLHSVRLIDELLKKGKGDLVSFMTYPGEFHYFTREHVLRDAWHRVDDFFEKYLKP